MKKRLSLILVILGLSLMFVVNVHSQVMVRGRVVRNSPNGPYPVAGVPVTIKNPATRVRSNPSYTGTDGMYYLYNVVPGDYVLEFWFSGFNIPPLVYQTRVAPSQPGRSFDIAPITLP